MNIPRKEDFHNYWGNILTVTQTIERLCYDSGRRGLTGNVTQFATTIRRIIPLTHGFQIKGTMAVKTTREFQIRNNSC